jgi:hypothetical protein
VILRSLASVPTAGTELEGKAEFVGKNLRRVAALGSSIFVTVLVGGAAPAGALLVAPSGDVQELTIAPPSVDLDQLTSDDRAFVFVERECTAAGGVQVDALNPAGGTFGDTTTQPGSLPTGALVDSYYVHFDQTTNAENVTVSGALRFDRPVVGLLFIDSTLAATDEVLGAPGTTYGGTVPARGYEGPSDVVQVSADGLTVTFSATVGSFQDELRIVTQGTCEPELPTAKEQCKDGGWVAFGFRNQGQCVAFVVTEGSHGGPLGDS